MVESNLTNYRRGVAADGSRHAADPEAFHRGLCGQELHHVIGVFQLGHPLSCEACLRLVEITNA